MEQLKVELSHLQDTVTELKLQVGRLISHVESEQRSSTRLSETIAKHDRILVGDNGKPGLRDQIARLCDQSKERKRQLNVVLYCLLPLIAKAAWEMYMKA